MTLESADITGSETEGYEIRQESAEMIGLKTEAKKITNGVEESKTEKQRGSLFASH